MKKMLMKMLKKMLMKMLKKMMMKMLKKMNNQTSKHLKIIHIHKDQVGGGQFQENNSFHNQIDSLKLTMKRKN